MKLYNSSCRKEKILQIVFEGAAAAAAYHHHDVLKRAIFNFCHHHCI